MCGLTGILAPASQSEPDAEQRVGVMADRLAHRGPDGRGVWAEGPIALGHRRLSILDLSAAGAQPMLSDSGRFVIAFNGEVYNHLDLRRDLAAAGAAPGWRGHSDTETLLAAITRWGLEETLRRSAGMFALAVWDRSERRLSLARDRMGEKPLYWGWAGRSLVFGSEIKALAAHPDFAGGICREALAQYLRFGYVPAPRSIHPGIYKLEPGTVLTVTEPPPPAPPVAPLRPGDSHGSMTIRRWWSLPDTVAAGAAAPLGDDVAAVDQLEATLSAAVARQMISDVPLGAFLSGGVDSSTIVALMQRQSSRQVRTFTVGFDDAAFDESPYALAVARHLGTDHNALHVTDADARQVIPDLPQMYDEPFADSSQIPTFLVCRAARQQVTVALSGDAGDELFGGYNRYFWGPRIWNRLSAVPLPMRQVLGRAISAVPVSAWNGIGAQYNRLRPGKAGVARLGDKAHRLAARLRTVRSMDDLYLSLVSEHVDPGALIQGGVAEPASAIYDPLPAVGAEDPVARMMFQDMRSYLPDDILCKVDRAAMWTSLETRVPFLDPEVIALAARLPMKMKIRDGTGKWALREVLYRHVPRALIDRPKAGFGIPVGAWLRGPLRDWAETLLSEQALARDGLLNPALIRADWADHLAGRRDLSSRLWIVLMLQAWRERSS